MQSQKGQNLSCTSYLAQCLMYWIEAMHPDVCLYNTSM